jgi:hypothetical protein
MLRTGGKWKGKLPSSHGLPPLVTGVTGVDTQINYNLPAGMWVGRKGFEVEQQQVSSIQEPVFSRETVIRYL